MIIQCEKCKTKFKLDESLLKQEGSKVRCSVCKHVFIAYPPHQTTVEEPFREELDEEFKETVALPKEHLADKRQEGHKPETEEKIDFDKAFESALHEKEGEVEITSEDLEGYEPEDFEKEASQMDSAEDAAKPEAKLVEEPVVEETPAEGQVEVRSPPKKSRVGLIILIIIFIIIAGAACIVYFAPQLIPDSLSFLKMPDKKVLKDLGVKRLKFKGVTGSFINTIESGQLFVVKGTVINDYSEPRSFILVKASVLDDKGGVVKSKQAYAGNSLSEDELKTLPFEEIERAMKNARGRGGSNVNIAPGSAVPFMIVFKDLPTDLSEFTVEAVSSSPGSPRAEEFLN